MVERTAAAATLDGSAVPVGVPALPHDQRGMGREVPLQAGRAAEQGEIVHTAFLVAVIVLASVGLLGLAVYVVAR